MFDYSLIMSLDIAIELFVILNFISKQLNPIDAQVVILKLFCRIINNNEIFE